MERSGVPRGSEVGGYEIIAPLGAGGMSTVYRAVDGAGNEVALKMLHPQLTIDPTARERLRREVIALHRLRHPAIARVIDAETDSSEAFIVTELIEGHNLDARVTQQGALAPAELAELAASLYDALAYVHGAGLLHRDLKPANVMMSPTGPVLIDFGIAQDQGAERVTSTGLIMGTPGYVPPEVLDGGEPDIAADWWGFAALITFAATGRHPFGTRPLEAVLGRCHAGDVDLNGLPARMSLALAAPLRAVPAARSTPMELVAELASIRDGGQATITIESPNYTGPIRTHTIAAPGTTAVLPLGTTAPRPQPAGPPPPAIAPLGAPDFDTDVATAGTATKTLPTRHALAFPAQPVGPPQEFSPQSLPSPNAAPPWQPPAVADFGQGAPAPQSAAGFGSGPTVGPGALPDPAATWQPPVPPSRWGVVSALAVLLTALAAVAPLPAGLVMIAGTWLFRSVGMTLAARDARQLAAQGAPQKAWRTWLSSPWHALRATVTMLPALVVGVSVAVMVGGIGLWLLDTGRLSPGLQPLWADASVCAIAALCGFVGLWFGPFSVDQRRGARWLLGRLVPTSSGTFVVWIGVALAIMVAYLLFKDASGVSWWPLNVRPNLS